MASNTSHAEKGKTFREHFNGFLNDYVPTNQQTYNYAIPIIGFSSSCISFGMFMTFIYLVKSPDFVNHTMYNFGYMVLSGACSAELYYGLRNNNRKQYTFYILLKIIEMALIIVTVTYCLFQEWTQYDFVAIGIILIVVKIMLLIYLARRASSKRTRNIVPQENLYDTPQVETRQTTYNNVSVY